MTRRMELTAPESFPLVQPGDDLTPLILTALHDSDVHFTDGDVLVLAQKIVSKAEDRFVELGSVQPEAEAFELALKTGKDPRLLELVLQESERVLRVRSGVIIVRHRLGFVCANAGIDHSNVSGPGPGDWVLLLPQDPDGSAAGLRAAIQRETGASIAVLIIDSHGRAWRCGTVGISIGMAGLSGLLDLRGKPDLFGETLQITRVGLADELAAAASLMMGQADEGAPVVHVRGFPYPLGEGSLADLLRPEEEDLFL